MSVCVQQKLPAAAASIVTSSASSETAALIKMVQEQQKAIAALSTQMAGGTGCTADVAASAKDDGAAREPRLRNTKRPRPASPASVAEEESDHDSESERSDADLPAGDSMSSNVPLKRAIDKREIVMPLDPERPAKQQKVAAVAASKSPAQVVAADDGHQRPGFTAAEVAHAHNKKVDTVAPAIAKSAGYNSEVEGSCESELDSEDEREGSGEKSKNSMVEATALVGAAAAAPVDRQPHLAARSAATINPHVGPTKAVPARRSAEERAADEAEEAAAHSLGWGPPPQSRPLLKRSSRKSKRRDRVVASQSSSAPAAVSQAVITAVPSLPAQRLGPNFLWRYDRYVCRTDRGLVGLSAPTNAYELWKAKGEPDADAWRDILEDACLSRKEQYPFAPSKWHWSPTSV